MWSRNSRVDDFNPVTIYSSRYHRVLHCFGYGDERGDGASVLEANAFWWERDAPRDDDAQLPPEKA